MVFAHARELRKQDWHDLLVVLLDQLHDVLVVPEVQRALGHLEVRRRDARADLPKQHVHHELELGRLDDVQDLLDLACGANNKVTLLFASFDLFVSHLIRSRNANKK